jgi:Na+:H+ antiporter, NhaA family
MSNVLKRFLAMESASGILLILAALAAILLANSGWAHLYSSFLDTRVQVRISALDLDKPLLLWVNDGLMALFFLLIGLEVKRELVEGALSRREQALFPALAALGGMVFPALWFLLFTADDPLTRNGWAIPAATDIAFALGVMALLGKRVPLSLKVFLLALAIIDDLGVILIIALFYSHGLSLPPLG